jgi:hypothetical protein
MKGLQAVFCLTESLIPTTIKQVHLLKWMKWYGGFRLVPRGNQRAKE